MPQISQFARIAPGVVIHPDARIKGRAVIDKQDDILVIGPVHGGYFTAHRDEDLGVRLVRLCHSGTVEEYEAKYEAYCQGNQYRIDACRDAVAWIKQHFGL